MTETTIRTKIAVLLIALTSTYVAAQDEPQRERPKPAPTAEAQNKPIRQASQAAGIDSITIEKIMEQAVKNIARRYNLNDAQTKKTGEIMKRGVYDFLREHEEEVWPLIRELLATGLRPPENLEDVKRIGKAARPLAKLAHEAILQGNEEWRMYLTPEQKRLHDYDLSEMSNTFEQIDQNFEKWAKGQPPDGTFFPPTPSPADVPLRPRKPDEGLPPPEVQVFDPRTIFDTFVEEFIKEYELNEAQVDSARSILAEFKAKANDFRNANKQELAELAEDMKSALESRDRKKLAEVEKARKALLEPVYELFGQMSDRLRALLTSAQIARHASADKSGSANQTEAATPRGPAQSRKQSPRKKDGVQDEAKPADPG